MTNAKGLSKPSERMTTPVLSGVCTPGVTVDLCHLGKGNTVEDNLSTLFMGILEHLSPTQCEMGRYLHILASLESDLWVLRIFSL